MLPSFRDLLVHLDGGTGDEARLTYAEALATANTAHVSGAFIHVEEMPVAAGFGGYDSGQILADLRAAFEKEGDKRGVALKERMDKLAVPTDLRRYDALPGQATEALCTEARTADLTIMTRPYGTDAGTPALAEAAIFGSGRGVVLLPDTGTPSATPDTVLIAWRNTPEAAHAVAAAMPFLTAAKSVVVAMVDEDGDPEQFGEEPGADIARHLDRHGIAVELRNVTGWQNVAEALLHEAAQTGAGMLVMGGYGHSRLREWVTGGVTRDILSSAAIPVLMAH